MNTQSSFQTEIGNRSLFIEQIISGSGSPEEVLKSLEKFGFEWHISEEGHSKIKSWTVAAEGFVTPAQAADIRASKPVNECGDDLDWLSKNLENVRAEFGNKWIAICENKIVGSSTSLPELIVQVEQFDKPLITFMTADQSTWTSIYAN